MQQPYVKLTFENNEEVAEFFRGEKLQNDSVIKKLGKQRPNLNGLAGAEQDQFAQMLEMDKQVYKNLYQAWYNYHLLYERYKKMPSGPVKNAEYNRLKPIAEKLIYLYNRYNARQNDYRTNTTYRVANGVKEWGDNVASKFKSAWNNLVSSLQGLGIAPAVIPIVIGAATLLSIAVVSFFIYKYYKSTQLDVDDSTKLIQSAYALDPEIGKSVANKLAGMYAEAGNGSQNPLAQLGQGAKTALAVAEIGRAHV